MPVLTRDLWESVLLEAVGVAGTQKESFSMLSTFRIASLYGGRLFVNHGIAYANYQSF